MGKLITIIGNCGVGKTTLALQLCKAGHYVAFLEQHKERPYHELFAGDLSKFSLHNQLDFLLYRAEQEISIRNCDTIGVQDGGLDQDYHIFTKFFHQKGYLRDEEFQLCDRLYSIIRLLLPVPDLIIQLKAPLSILKDRRVLRRRTFDIVELEDLDDVEILICDWLANEVTTPILSIDASDDDPAYTAIVPLLIEKISGLL